ncbi:MAG TPA: hypothetical protein DEA96_02170 [Leptospiraceae bacterium]|nr:hypothetical protein [Spirochaetaceae bacterium]HBS03741.1 hypothetical protein [Leptospiraceae bacterium]
MSREYYIDPSFFLQCASSGSDAKEARAHLQEDLKQGAHFFTSAISFIQWAALGPEAGLDSERMLSMADGFQDLCSEVLPFGPQQWQRARSIRLESGISLGLACHAASALEAGLIWIYSTSPQYKRVPGLVPVGPGLSPS